MKNFKNFSTFKKLFIGFGSFLLIIFIVVGIALYSLNDIVKQQKNLTDIEFQKAINLKTINSNQNFNRATVLEIYMGKTPEEIINIKNDIKRKRISIDSLFNLIKAKETSNITLNKIQVFQDSLNNYRKLQDYQIDLAANGRFLEAQTLGKGIQSTRFIENRIKLAELFDESIVSINDSLEANVSRRNQIFIFFIFISIAALLAAIFMIIFYNKLIAAPLKEITTAASKISKGELNIEILSDNRTDEVGELSNSFRIMTESLKNLSNVAENLSKGNLTDTVKPVSENDVFGNSFANMVVNMRKSTAEIAEGINLLGSSANEILVATSQIATGSTETATAINQTTTTVEEVRQASQLSSHKARTVADKAQNVIAVTESGKKSVEEMVNVMKNIQDQMNEIANTVILLSDYTQSIGGIIASVDDIADQSNLLAVNAAIEASKAGEFGKGFVVVAQEIKSMAEQSKKATIEVRKMLFDIQKATSSAVLSTEKGNKAVETGVKQSMQAGEAIQSLSESIKDSVDSSIQIVASSQQQEVGMDQVSIAMDSINQSILQNTTSMKQAEDAARNLNEFGEKLKSMVAYYKL